MGFNGRTKISFSRSTDSGRTFSRPIELSYGKDVQGCDIAVEHDGDVYVAWGTRNTPSAIDAQGMAIARSTDGGASFAPAHQIATFTRYFPSDGDRNCGDGALTCPSRFVFFRVPLEPRITADQSGVLLALRHLQRGRPGDRRTQHDSYSSAGSNSRLGRPVGRLRDPLDEQRPGLVVAHLGRSGRRTWPPVLLGHRRARREAGRRVAGQPDRRRLQRAAPDRKHARRAGPAGFLGHGRRRHVRRRLGRRRNVRSDRDHLVDDAPAVVRDVQPSLPFQGDYNYVALAFDGPTSLFGYMAWTDNRDVRPGVDIRETDYVDGFDVFQCRAAGARPDLCPNAHGLDQNIYGQSITLPAG